MLCSITIAGRSPRPVSVVDWSVAGHPLPFTLRHHIATANPKRPSTGLFSATTWYDFLLIKCRCIERIIGQLWLISSLEDDTFFYTRLIILLNKEHWLGFVLSKWSFLLGVLIVFYEEHTSVNVCFMTQKRFFDGSFHFCQFGIKRLTKSLNENKLSILLLKYMPW